MEDLSQALSSIAGQNPALASFLLLLTFGYWLPVPEELALVAVGLTLRAAGLPFHAALAISISALVISDSSLYFISRFLGKRLIKIRIIERVLRSERVLAAERAFARSGPRFIFVARFIVGLRSASIIASGFLRLPYLSFLAPTAAAMGIGVGAWLAIGYFAGPGLGAKLDGIGSCLPVAGALAVAAAMVAVGIAAGRRLRAEGGQA
jgi:membrane protein DedA with SNARE-associated domain